MAAGREHNHENTEALPVKWNPGAQSAERPGCQAICLATWLIIAAAPVRLAYTTLPAALRLPVYVLLTECFSGLLVQMTTKSAHQVYASASWVALPALVPSTNLNSTLFPRTCLAIST